MVFGSGYSSPDFALVLAVEQVLAAHPLSHDKLQRRLPCWTREAAQKLQQRIQLGVGQVGKHHDRRLEGGGEGREGGGREGVGGERGRVREGRGEGKERWDRRERR